MGTMDVEFEKRCASSLSSSSSSSASEEEERVDRLVKTEEIEAAETLAQLAMRQIDAADKWCTKRDSTRVTRESPTLHSDPSPSPLAIGGQAVAGQQLDEKKSPTTDVETERIQQNDCLGHMKVDQDADLPKTTSYSSGRCNKSRRNLTEEEKEARRIRRVLANRESARQTIRRRQALSEELTRKAATLVMENENLKKEKELALKEYQSLETTNRHLKAQIAKSINTEVEKTPVEQESSVAEVTPVSGSSPWFLYNHFPVTQLFWPSILQSSNPVQLQHTPFNSIAIPPHVYVPSSESESCHNQNNLINDNQTQNPLYMFPCPWLYPLPEYGNGLSPPSSGHKQDKLPLGKQYNTALSLNTMANVDYQAALPIKLKTEARSIDDSGCATLSFSSDGGEQKTGGHIIEKFHGQAFGCNSDASAVKQEPELQLHSAPNAEVSSSTTSSVEKKQEQFICPGKNLVDAVAAAEARKRRKELTKLKGIHNRQSRMEC